MRPYVANGADTDPRVVAYGALANDVKHPLRIAALDASIGRKADLAILTRLRPISAQAGHRGRFSNFSKTEVTEARPRHVAFRKIPTVRRTQYHYSLYEPFPCVAEKCQSVSRDPVPQLYPNQRISFMF